jgi:hypothetical protein
MSVLPRGRYGGSSKARDPEADPTLELAILDAYEKAIADKPEADRLRRDGTQRKYRFKVDAIFIEGTNPPSDYKVELVDH